MGNSAFPLLRDNPSASVYACDFSERAIALAKAHPDYQSTRIVAEVADITDHNPFGFLQGALIDVCTFIFVLSAIHPANMAKVSCCWAAIH